MACVRYRLRECDEAWLAAVDNQLRLALPAQFSAHQPDSDKSSTRPFHIKVASRVGSYGVARLQYAMRKGTNDCPELECRLTRWRVPDTYARRWERCPRPRS